MTLQRQVSFWLIALAVFVVLLYLLSGILLPFVAGLALAYLLDPLATRLQRLHFSRLAATLVILGLFILIFVLVLTLLLPLLANQLAAFAARLPSLVNRLQQLVMEQGGPLIERLGGGDSLADIQRSFGNVVSQGAGFFATFLQSVWSGGTTFVGVLSLLVITPVVAFYLLVDWQRMVATIDGWVPPRNREIVRDLARQMDRAIAGFIRGQSLVCVFLGIFYAIGLSLIGLNFAVLIALLSGFLSFIPYVGSLTGLLLAVGVAVVQFWPDWVMILATLAVFAAGQFIEGNIVQPKLVGESVGLHPVWVMFALLAFGSLFGFVGLLLAVPLAAVIGVLARFAVTQYLGSALYRSPGEDPAAHAARDRRR